MCTTGHNGTGNASIGGLPFIVCSYPTVITPAVHNGYTTGTNFPLFYGCLGACALVGQRSDDNSLDMC
jgi:hypothetical protein